jgi:hypothetical protein
VRRKKDEKPRRGDRNVSGAYLSAQRASILCRLIQGPRASRSPLATFRSRLRRDSEYEGACGRDSEYEGACGANTSYYASIGVRSNESHKLSENSFSSRNKRARSAAW